MDDIYYRYLDLLNTTVIGLLVVIIAVFYIYLTLESIRSADAGDRENALSSRKRRATAALRPSNKPQQYCKPVATDTL